MIKKYKIAYILTSVTYGGLEKVSSCFLNKHDRQRFDVYPIVLIRPWEKENIFIQSLKGNKFFIYKVPVALYPPGERRDIFRVPRCFKKIYTILKKGSFDLVHTQGYFANIVGIPMARILRIPTISTCHGFISNDRNLTLYNALDRIILRYSNKIIAVSNGIKNDLIRSRIQESRIVVIKNAVNGYYNHELFVQERHKARQCLNVNNKEFVLGYVGRLSEEKGIKFLVEATSMLNQSGVPMKLLIIGEGPQKKVLESLVSETNIESKVIFAGFQNNIENWFPAMDIFVLPSLTEGIPMSLLEAMSCGIPAVASAVGGVPQVIDSGKNGILVSPGRPEEIKDAVQILCEDEVLRNNISQVAQKTIKLKYNVNDWIKKIETEYMRVLN